MRSKPKPRQPELWNAQALADADAYDLPRYWLLISPVEAQALADGVVGSNVKRQCETLMKDEPVLSVQEKVAV